MSHAPPYGRASYYDTSQNTPLMTMNCHRLVAFHEA